MGISGTQTPIGSVVGKRGGEDMEIDETNVAKKVRTECVTEGKEHNGEKINEAGLPEQSCKTQ